MSPSGDWRRAAVRRALACGLVLVAGIVLAALGGATLLVGGALIALGLIGGVSLVFLEVGYGEDRARAREERPPAPPAAASGDPHAERTALRPRPRRRR